MRPGFVGFLGPRASVFSEPPGMLHLKWAEIVGGSDSIIPIPYFVEYNIGLYGLSQFSFCLFLGGSTWWTLLSHESQVDLAKRQSFKQLGGCHH